ncbi:hypothetical protein EJB05_42900, partial [Eragrostis curvula]
MAKLIFLFCSSHLTGWGIPKFKPLRPSLGAAGKFYAHLVDNKIVTLEFSPDPTFTAVRVRGRPLPLGGCYVTYCRLLESCGDLFMVKFWCTPFSERRILCVRVRKLDWSTGAWVKVTGLGVNRAFFVHSSIGTSMAADELGLKADCIYFTMDDDKGLYVHDLEQGTTTSHDPGPEIPNNGKIVLIPALAVKEDTAAMVLTSKKVTATLLMLAGI